MPSLDPVFLSRIQFAWVIGWLAASDPEQFARAS